MKVNLAVHVLSKSVAIGLRESGDEVVSDTAEFCDMMNGFLTVPMSLTEHTRKNNPFIMPYSSPNDYRLTWLKDVFLTYLNNWKESTLTCEGNFSSDERQRMFISAQTCEGLKIAVYPYIEAITFLLLEGFQ